MHVEFNSNTCFLSVDSEADSGKLATSAWEFFTGLMNAPPLRCYYFFGVKITS